MILKALFPSTVATLWLACCFLQISLSPIEAAPSSPSELEKLTYGVIVDCGSSGTRANIFVWDSLVEFPEFLNQIRPLKDDSGKAVTKKIFPGLSSFSDEPNDADRYMNQIINFISEAIPSESHQSTVIYIMATAGMRLLDKDTQLRIIDEIASSLNNDHKFAKARTSVIPGTFEGMYQWISVNSKLKRFVDRRKHKPNPQTFGIIEMGGASIQVAYQILPGMDGAMYEKLEQFDKSAADAYEASLLTPDLSNIVGGYKYKLFSTTFLGFGSKSAREAYVDLLVSKNGNLFTRACTSLQCILSDLKVLHVEHLTLENPLELKDPCLPKGSHERMMRPRRLLFPEFGQTIGYIIEDNDVSFNVDLAGTGNYYHCKKLVKTMLETAKAERMNCNSSDVCGMDLLGTPFVAFDEFKFYGLADFYYTTNLMMELAGTYNQASIVTKTRNICDTSFEVLQHTYPDATQDKTRIMMECFKAVWVETFLTDGLLMPANYKNFDTIGQIDGDPLEWTLGAVIDKSASIDAAI